MATPKQPEPEPEQPIPPAPTTELDKWFVLSKPLVVGDRKLDKLLIDPAELEGNDFFQIVRQYKMLHPREAATGTIFQRFNDEDYLSTVVARLNQITPEDLQKLKYRELSVLFMRAASFHFTGGES